MGEDMDAIKRLPAEKNSWYALLKLSSSQWNAYMHNVATKEDKKTFLQGIAELSPQEKQIIHSKIRAEFLGWSPPSGDFLHLNNLVWSQHLNIMNKKIPIYTIFDGSIFNGLFISSSGFSFVSFHLCNFQRAINISNCVFYEGASFLRSYFKEQCHFNKDITFKSKLIFTQSTFESGFTFSDCTFEDDVDCTNITSNDKIVFKNCTFRKNIILDGSKINSSLQFSNCTFELLPSLVGCSIVGDLEIDIKSIINLPARQEEISKWVKLKYEMNRLHRHREETDFFIKELKCRALSAKWKEKILIMLYGTISDFGRSALLPLGALIYFFILFTALYEFTFFDTNGSLEYSSYLSSKAAFPFIPKDAALSPHFEELNFGPTKEFSIRMIQGVQFIISATLLFLIGLGIRNRLRIK